LRFAKLAVDGAGDLGAFDFQVEVGRPLLTLKINRDRPFAGAGFCSVGLLCP
jgi:hypothetical protein